MIPELSPNSVSATGAYQVALVLAALSMGIGAILRFLPSRKWKAEGRDLMKTAFETVLLASSFMTAEFIVKYLKGVLGFPEWDQLLAVVANLEASGIGTLNMVTWLAIAFGTVASILDVLSKFIPLIATFIMHFFMAVAFSVLSFFASLAALVVVMAKMVKVVAAMAAHAYLLVAAGIALFGWKHTRALGIALLVFGVALFYGLPVILGFVKPAEPYAASPDEEARAKILMALTENSVPTKISVVSAGGKPLYFSYISMNSSVLVKDVPLNSTLIANITGGPLRNEKGDVTYHFVYGRFYNESYSRRIRCTYVVGTNIPFNCFDDGTDYSKVKELRHQLYRNSTVRYVWYLGLLLPVRDNRVQVSGPSLTKPLIEIPSDISQIAGSLHKAFGGLRSEDEYWEMVYGRSKPVRIDVPVVRELNQNVTAFVLFNETKYRSWRELEEVRMGGTREYVHNYTIPRVSEHCWVSRTEEYFDPSCNCTRTRYYYKARAEYRYESPYVEQLVLVHLPTTVVYPKLIHYFDDGPGRGEATIVMNNHYGDPSYALEKGLILGYGPLKLKFNQGLNKTQLIPKPTNEAANQIRGNPGYGTGTVRELREFAQPEVTLNPDIMVWTISIRHTKVIETGEQEGSCPTTPPHIKAWSWIGFDVKNYEPWDPYAVGIFKWGEYSKTGEYEYRPPKSLGDAPSLGAYKPSDPRLVHRFYEEDPREPASNLEKYGAPLLMRFGTPISQLAYISFAFLITMAVADAVTMWLGGTSLGLVGAARAIAGMAGGMQILSPFGISRYPLFGRDMVKAAIKRIEARIWREAEQQLKKMEKEAKIKGDLATLRSIWDFRRADRAWKRAHLKKRIIDKLFPNGGWWIYNKIMRGGPERDLNRLKWERYEALSRLLPDYAVLLQELSRLKSERRLTREEAWQVLSMVKNQARGAWPLAIFSLLTHSEGRATIKSLLFGRLGGKVPVSWFELGYRAPMAHRRLGFDWIKVRETEEDGKKKVVGIPIPTMKAGMVGPGFTFEITKEKVALRREMLNPSELKAELEKRLAEIQERARQEGREIKDPIGELLKHPSFRELSPSQIREVLEGRGHGEYPVWRATPIVRNVVPHESGNPEIHFETTHSELRVENVFNMKDPRTWFQSDQDITLRRKESGEEIKVDGTMIDIGEKLRSTFGRSPFSSQEEERKAEEKFREMAEEKTRHYGENWAWHLTEMKVRWKGEKGDGEENPTNPSIGADLKAGIEKAMDEAEEGSREGASRTKDLWGDGE